MTFNPNPALLGAIPGGSQPQNSQSSNYMQTASAVLGNWDRTPEDPGPTLGGALGAGLGGAMTAAGAGAALGAAGMGGTAAATFLTGGLGLGVAAGIGILSHIFS